MTELNPFICEDSNGSSHTFYWRVKQEERGWCFYVHRTNPFDPSDDFYEAQLEFLEAFVVYTITITNNNCAWAFKKGISEALFDVMSRVTKCKIVSSRSFVSGSSERQSAFATGMWKRFCCNGLAKFDDLMGRYVWLG